MSNTSAVIDFDYIMSLVADNLGKKSDKYKMTKTQVISLLKSDANLMDEEENLSEYINTLDWNSGVSVEALKKDFDTYVVEKNNKELADIANAHGLQTADLKAFIDSITDRMIFDGEKLTDLLAPLALPWKARKIKELALMENLVPHLKKIAQGQEISGLAAYE